MSKILLKQYDDIDSMSSNEWLNYREELLETFYMAGYTLKPTIGCNNCDISEDYTCFHCECEQINQVEATQ